VIVVGGVVLDDLLVIPPGWQLLVPHEAVVGQMSAPPVAQVHNAVFSALVDRVGIDASLQVVRLARIVAEGYRPLPKSVSLSWLWKGRSWKSFIRL
jgi:hypothetical protein